MRLGLYPARLTPGSKAARGLRRRGHLRAPPPPLRGEQPLPGDARGGRDGPVRASRPTGGSSRSSSCATTPGSWPASSTPSSRAGPSGRTRSSTGSWRRPWPSATAASRSCDRVPDGRRRLSGTAFDAAAEVVPVMDAHGPEVEPTLSDRAGTAAAVRRARARSLPRGRPRDRPGCRVLVRGPARLAVPAPRPGQCRRRVARRGVCASAPPGGRSCWVRCAAWWRSSPPWPRTTS